MDNPAGRGCAGGSISNLCVVDSGDCCLHLQGGTWRLHTVRLRCAHGSALKVSNSARAHLEKCTLGGEARGEFAATLTRACFGLIARDEATVSAEGCSLVRCSEAALLLANGARVSLMACSVSDCPAAFLAGKGRGRALEIKDGCQLGAQRLWADTDRPRVVHWGEAGPDESRADEPLFAAIADLIAAE